MNFDRAEIERALHETAGVHAAVQVDRGQVVLSGIVRSEGQHQAALDVLRDLAPQADVIDDLVVEPVLPAEVGGLPVSEAEVEGFPGAEPETRDDERLEPGDFTDQDTLRDPWSGSGPSGTRAEDELDEGDRVFVPPTDPVRTPEGEFLGGFQETSEADDVAPHTEMLEGSPDEAIVEAVLTELHQDAATESLDIEVTCEQGVVYLDGTVGDLDDAQNAQAVASRVRGVVEVRDRLEVAAG